MLKKATIWCWRDWPQWQHWSHQFTIIRLSTTWCQITFV